MIIVYPKSLVSKKVDEMFEEEYLCIKKMFDTCLVDQDNLLSKKDLPLPAGLTLLYRGWMLPEDVYSHLNDCAVHCQSSLVVSPQQYLLSHHINNWYPLVQQDTAQTVFGSEHHLPPIPFEECFVKDFVKSSSKSLCKKENIAQAILAIKHHRQGIEGGIAIRQKEEYMSDEYRSFVVNQRLFTNPQQNLPPQAVALLEKTAPVLLSPFSSVDIRCRQDGKWRIVEIGDGQVSDFKEWNVQDFASMIKHGFSPHVKPKPPTP